MPPAVSFQGAVRQVQSLEEFGATLDDIYKTEDFELWLSVEDGPRLCMLRHNDAALLMYLEYEGDAGCTSVGNPEAPGAVQFQLCNGQVDEYPAAWCVGVEGCYKALAYFFVNEGLRPHWITWQES
jgi:hypothetical protein